MKKTLAAFALATVMMVSTTFANGGIIVFGAAGEAPTNECTDPTRELGGILVGDFGGIIVFGFTGIIVSDFGDPKGTTTSCGIMVAD